ncbi:hypothetical protein ACIP5N_21620 [Streptomyces sp. NPDC088768]|uniref:hypothetical protein n=1 Tax=Streptomyces sp. NPDC088768 TaxID=3365894 RepID=UPI0038004960
MRALLKELAVPFEDFRQTPRLLLLPLMTGSRLIASFLLRRAALAVKLVWTEAMNFKAPPAKAAPAEREQDDASAADSTGRTAAGVAEASGKEARAAADDAIERIGLGCLILLFVGVIVAGLIWLFMWLVWPHIAAYAPVASAVLVGAWVVTAWMIAPPVQETITRNDHENSAGEQAEESEPDRLARGLARFIVAAVRDAAPAHMGVHIAELLERLQQEERNFDDWDQTRLREWCTAAGIPVSRNVRAKGKGPTWGVRADELQQAFNTSLDEAVEVLSRPVPRASSEGAPAGPVQAEDGAPVAPLTAPPARAPVPAAPSAPVQPRRQTVPAPSPDVAR